MYIQNPWNFWQSFALAFILPQIAAVRELNFVTVVVSQGPNECQWETTSSYGCVMCIHVFDFHFFLLWWDTCWHEARSRHNRPTIMRRQQLKAVSENMQVSTEGLVSNSDDMVGDVNFALVVAQFGKKTMAMQSWKYDIGTTRVFKNWWLVVCLLHPTFHLNRPAGSPLNVAMSTHQSCTVICIQGWLATRTGSQRVDKGRAPYTKCFGCYFCVEFSAMVDRLGVEEMANIASEQAHRSWRIPNMAVSIR